MLLESNAAKARILREIGSARGLDIQDVCDALWFNFSFFCCRLNRLFSFALLQQSALPWMLSILLPPGSWHLRGY